MEQEISDSFSNLVFGNLFDLVLVCVNLLIIFAKCIEPFYASTVEIVLMKKGDALKRTSLSYLILFFSFGVLNYIAISKELYMCICGVLLIILMILYFACKAIDKWGKFPKLMKKYKKREQEFAFTMMLVAFPFFAYYINHSMASMELSRCIVVGSLIEVFITSLTYLSPVHADSNVLLILEDKAWYVYKRMDKYLLCGDKKSIDSCSKIKLFEFEEVVKTGYFVKEKE